MRTDRLFCTFLLSIDSCIQKLLKDKLVILVTHQVQFLKDASDILCLQYVSLSNFYFSTLVELESENVCLSTCSSFRKLLVAWRFQKWSNLTKNLHNCSLGEYLRVFLYWFLGISGKNATTGSSNNCEPLKLGLCGFLKHNSFSEWFRAIYDIQMSKIVHRWRDKIG